MKSLRIQLTLPIIAVFVVLGLVTYFLLEQQIRSRLTAEFDQALLARAQVLQRYTQFEEADPEEGEPEPFLEFDLEPAAIPEYAAPLDEESAPEQAVAWFQLWEDDRAFARSGSLAGADLPRTVSAGGDPVFRDLVLPDGAAGRTVTLQFAPWLDEEWGEAPAARLDNLHRRYPDLEYPTMTLAVAVPRAPLDDTLVFVDWILAAGLFTLMLVVSLLVAVLTGHGLRPLRRLTEQLNAVDSERMDQRVDETSLPRELTPVAHTVNTLLDRLEAAFQKERLFTRNIAHELRTPIAELRSIGEVGARWPDDPSANAGFFEDVGRIGSRMDLIVSNLLTMARQESGQAVCNREELDLAERLRAMAGRLDTECEARGMTLEVSGPSRLLVRADRGHLEMILTNLLCNAVFHGSPGEPVTVGLTSEGGRAAIAVENGANGLEPDDLPHLFDRFWRKDPGQDGHRHAGLGLPLVRSLASVCDWTVHASIEPGHRFRIVLGEIEVVDEPQTRPAEGSVGDLNPV